MALCCRGPHTHTHTLTHTPSLPVSLIHLFTVFPFFLKKVVGRRSRTFHACLPLLLPSSPLCSARSGGTRIKTELFLNTHTYTHTHTHTTLIHFKPQMVFWMERGFRCCVCVCVCVCVYECGSLPSLFSLLLLLLLLLLLCVQAAVLLLRFFLSLCLPTFSFGNVFCVKPTATDLLYRLLISPHFNLTHPAPSVGVCVYVCICVCFRDRDHCWCKYRP